MVSVVASPLTLAEYLARPESCGRYELIDGALVPKMSPKRFHSRTQRAFLYLLDGWGEDLGEVGVEWSVILEKDGQAWVPVPDLLFVFNERLPADLGDEACSVAPDLVIEIISPGQTFGEMAEKAVDYVSAGVARVWMVDSQAQTITVFAANAMPVTYRGDRLLSDGQFPGLELTAAQVFQRAGLAS